MHPDVNPKIKEFIEEYKAELYRLPLDKATLQAEQLGKLLRDNEVGIYSLNDVESFLINEYITNIPMDVSFIDNRQSSRAIFIATELYHVGGHTRLMERLASFLESKPDLLITKHSMDTIIKREMNFFSNVYHAGNCVSSVLEKIKCLLNVILKYDLLILNIHPEDIYSVVACGLAKKMKEHIKIHFVNHSDHTFSYGSSISDVWYEISHYGMIIDSMRGLNARKCFLGIPIDTNHTITERSYTFDNGDLILSAASGGKYKPRDQQSILPLVSALLDKYDKSTFQVIGVNVFTNHWWWAMKLKYWGRLRLSKSLPYEEYIKVTSAAKLYIDSHPLPGGTAFAEQFLQGRLCVGLKCRYNGYTPLEVFKKECVDDVLSEIDSISIHNIFEVKRQVEEKHSFDSVKARFLDSILKNKYAKECVHISTPSINHTFEKIPVRVINTFKIRSVSKLKSFCFLCIRKVFLKVYNLRPI